ncbi:MAG: metallophosphoesterase [Sandaracinaceae bacterium]
MSKAPASVEEAAEHAKSVEDGQSRRFLSLVRPAKKPVIELRRFAGPTRFIDQLDGLKIAHLTDLHFGRVTPERVQREAIRLTNEQKPDLVVITGDFVCHSQMYLHQLTSVLSELEAPTIGVLGNHDYWSGAEEVHTALRRAGVELLRNRHTTLTLRHQRLQVVGLDDAYTGHADRHAAVKGLRPDLPVIGLSHIAEEADGLWHHDIPLVLSGHTHAGQVTLARLHELAIGRLAGHKYVHGLYGSRRPDDAARGAVYVGAGIGAAVMPLRLGDRGRREVAMFELGAHVGSIDEHHSEQPPLPGRKPSPELTEKRKAAVKKKAAQRERERKRNGTGTGTANGK